MKTNQELMEEATQAQLEWRTYAQKQTEVEVRMDEANKKLNEQYRQDHPGFTVICKKCGSSKAQVKNDCDTEVYFICSVCGQTKSIAYY